MTLALDDIPVIPSDVPPEFDGEPEFACLTCGKAIEYSGRGRKPKYCDDHKRRSNSSGSRSAIPSGNNDKLASMAVDVLCQANALIGMGLMLGQMNRTASALADREDAFRMQAYEALKTDPALCKMILKAGATSAKISLGIAYGLLAISIAPVALAEIREKKAEKEAERAERENAA